MNITIQDCAEAEGRLTPQSHNFVNMVLAKPMYRIAGARPRSTPYTVSERLARLEKKVKYNTHETKSTQVQISTSAAIASCDVLDLTDLQVGVSDDTRNGNAVYITGLALRIWADSSVLDFILTISPMGITPVYAHFTPNRPAQILLANSDDVKELKYIRNFAISADPQYIDYKIKFKKPIIVQWNSTASWDVNKNRICLCTVNNGTAAHAYKVNSIVYFKDH